MKVFADIFKESCFYSDKTRAEVFLVCARRKEVMEGGGGGGRGGGGPMCADQQQV